MADDLTTPPPGTPVVQQAPDPLDVDAASRLDLEKQLNAFVSRPPPPGLEQSTHLDFATANQAGPDTLRVVQADLELATVPLQNRNAYTQGWVERAKSLNLLPKDYNLGWKFAEGVRERGTANAFRYLQSLGLQDVQGPEVESAKEAVYSGIQAFEQVRALPILNDRDRQDLSHAALMSIVNRRERTLRDQIGNRQPSANEQASLDRLSKLKTLDPVQAGNVVDQAQYYTNRGPLNKHDQAVADSLDAQAVPLPGLVLFGGRHTRALEKAKLGDGPLKILPPQGELAFPADPALTALEAFAEELGQNAPDIITAEAERHTMPFKLFKLGVTPTYQPATSTDGGYTFMQLDPRIEPAVKKLLDAKTLEADVKVRFPRKDDPLYYNPTMSSGPVTKAATPVKGPLVTKEAEYTTPPKKTTGGWSYGLSALREKAMTTQELRESTEQEFSPLARELIAVNPALEKSLKQIYKERGLDAMTITLKDKVRVALDTLSKQSAAQLSMPADAPEKLSAMEQDTLSVGARIGMFLGETLKTAIDLPVQVAKDLDEEVSKSKYVQAELYGAGLMIGQDDEVANRMRTIRDVAQLSTHLAMDQGRMFAALGGTTQPLAKGTAVEQANPMYAGLDGASRLALLKASNDAMAVYNNRYSRMLDGMELNGKTVNDWFNGKASFKDGSQALMGLMAGTWFSMVAEPVYMVADDPTEAVGFIVGGKLLGMAHGKIAGTIRGANARLFYSARLKDAAIRLAEHNPMAAQQIVDAARAGLRAAKSEPEVTARLENTLAIAELALDNTRKTGTMGEMKGPFSRTLQQNFPLLRDYMGDLATAMVDPRLKLTATEKLGALTRAYVDPIINLFTGPFGKEYVTRPKGFTKAMDWAWGKDVAARAKIMMDGVLSGDSTSMDFQRNVEQFVRRTGRTPNDIEVVELMPKPLADLTGLIRAGQRAGYKDPAWRRAMGKLGLFKESNRFADLVDATENIEQAVVTQALLHAQRRLGHGVFQARARYIGDLQLRKYNSRLAEHDVYRAATAHSGPLDEWIARPDGTMAERSTILRELDEARTKLEASRERLVKYRTSLDESDPFKSFKMPGAEELPELWDGLGPDAWADIIDQNPTLFPGWTSDAVTRLRHLKPDDKAVVAARERLATIDADLTKARGMIDPMRKTPRNHDDHVIYHRGELKKYRTIRDNLAKVDPDTPIDPVLEHRIGFHEHQLRQRLRQLSDGKVLPTRLQKLLDDINTLKTDRHAAVQHLADMVFNTREREFDPRGLKRFIDRFFSHRGLEAHADEITMLETVRAGLSGLETAKVSVANPFDFKWMPAYTRGGALYNVIKGLHAHAGLMHARAEAQAGLVNQLTHSERRVLGWAIRNNDALLRAMARTGKPLIEHIQSRYPRVFEALISGPDGARLDTTGVRPRILEKLWWEDQGNWKIVHEALAATGKVDPATMSQFRDAYVRRYYAALERPTMIQSTSGKAALRAQTAKPLQASEINVGMDNTEFLFKRDLYKWRLRVAEEGQVVDKKFNSRDEATAYLDRTYGPKTSEKLAGTGGVEEGHNMYGHKMSLGSPLGKTWAEAMQPNVRTSQIAQTRTRALTEVFEDVMTSTLIDSMNLFGEMVIDKDQMIRLQDKHGPEFVAKYQKLPDNELVMGSLRGKYIHKSALAEWNRANSTYKTLGRAIEGLREAYLADKAEIPNELVNRASTAADNLFDIAIEAGRNSLITLSPRTWFVNPFFNLFSDHLIGGKKYLSVEGWANFVWAIQELRKSTAIRSRLARGEDLPAGGEIAQHPLYHEAQRLGLISGFYETENTQMRLLEMDLFGVGKGRLPADLHALRARRIELRDRLAASHRAGDQSLVDTVQKDITAIEFRIKDAEEGLARQFGRWVGGVFNSSLNRSHTGLPMNEKVVQLRALYNMIDEHFKLSKFKSLIDDGWTPDMAAKHIKMYAQNYPEVPYGLKAMSPAIRSMVVSFPYEFLRINANAIRTQPLGWVSFVGMLPALNIVQMASAGISPDRWASMMQQRGFGNNWVSQLGGMMTNLFITDPTTGDIHTQLNFSSFMDYFGAFAGRGPIKAALDANMPPEKRDWIQSSVAAVGGMASAFFMNNPAWNVLAYAFTGRDSTTGRLFLPRDATFTERAVLGTKVATAGLVPPWTPFLGRDWQDAEQSWDVTYNPKTGKPERMKQRYSAAIKTLFGVGVKGRWAQQIENTMAQVGLGRVRALPNVTDDKSLTIQNMYKVNATDLVPDAMKVGDTPTYGYDNDLRSLAFQWVDRARTPQERAQAFAALHDALRSNNKQELEGIKYEARKTGEEFARFKYGITRYGITSAFRKYPLAAKALILALNDRDGVNRRLQYDLLDATLFSEANKQATFDDPEEISNALTILSQRQAQPDHGPAIDELANRLKIEYQIARFKAEPRAIKTERKQQIQQQVGEARRRSRD